MSKEWAQDFAACKACGSTERFFESMGKELIDRGIMPQNSRFAMESKQGVIGNDAMIARLPIGSDLPAFRFETDICMKCGTIYVVRLRRIGAKKNVTPAKLSHVLPFMGNSRAS